MSAMLSVARLEAGPEVLHEYLKPKPEIKWPPFSDCVDADVFLYYEIHTPTGAFKIKVGPHYFESFTKGNAKALDLIYAPSIKHTGILPFASACQKVPSAMPVSCLRKAKKNLAVGVLLGDGRPRASQKVGFACSGPNEDAIFLHHVWEKNNDGRIVSVGLLPIILRRPCCERGQQRD